ncbi:MAG: hypothetical protein HOE62_16805 [Alphaproteobacteria bacterium]|jgi:hypothetical protein|nr:hypothetical protein [Alphaproteobacteria bacterium]MBT4019615.1 hypothetical protein [Alphaproteobacteria bacterium]MBT4967116.1 hypothetical protein [Alphaproteobacteria bacterium]MBT5160815.1 hypothetical protein [Alphaproteobacteria bacterium]MBT5917889.1 hypothetical protein [Alphaproteobacteria bacterium]
MNKVKFALFCAIFFGATMLNAVNPAQAEDLTFTLTNGTDVRLVNFHVSHTGTKRWEEDVLDDVYLAPGYSIEITIADDRRNCHYDVLSRFSDGEEVEDYNIDLCDLGEYEIGN